MEKGKQTYKLPEGWIEKSIEELAIIYTGNTPSKKNPQYYGNKIPFYKPSDLNTGIVYSSEEKLSEEGGKVARVLPANSILVTCIASIGKTGLIKNKGAFNQP